MTRLGARRLVRGPAACLKEALGRYDVPTFPQVGREVLAMLQNPNVDFRRVVRSLERDPGLVALVMRTVNAAGFGPRRAVKSLDVAVSMIGLRSLESMVVSATVPALLNTQSGTKGMDLKAFWSTSAQRAFLARALAERVLPDCAAACYVAALLQDMALPFLVRHRPEAYGPLLEAWRAGELGDLAEAERATFGFDHQQVAGWICSVWSLPFELHEAIANHHEADETPSPVHAVSFIVEGRAPLESPLFVSAAQELLGGEGAAVEDLVTKAVESADQLSGLLLDAKLAKPPRRLRGMR